MRVVCRAAPRAQSSTRVRRGLGACVPRRSCSPQNERRPARMYGGRFYWERNKGGDVCAKFRPGRGSRQRKMLTTRRRPRASPTASTRRARCSASGYDRARHERWSPQVEQAARATSDRRAQHRGSVRRDVGRVSSQTPMHTGRRASRRPVHFVRRTRDRIRVSPRRRGAQLSASAGLRAHKDYCRNGLREG